MTIIAIIFHNKNKLLDLSDLVFCLNHPIGLWRCKKIGQLQSAARCFRQGFAVTATRVWKSPFCDKEGQSHRLTSPPLGELASSWHTPRLSPALTGTPRHLRPGQVSR